MIDDFGPLLDDLGTETITVRTFSEPALNAYGEATDAATEVQEPAVVHPAPREMVERHLAADRRGGTVAVHVRAPTALSSPRTARPPHVLRGARAYQVIAVEDYASQGGVVVALVALLDP